MQRRKTLVNALVNSKIIDTKERAKEILKSLEMNEDIRGEKLSIQEFEKLSNFISENL
jgi:16S rRNA (adenine1518-N6/adenine1519-N6)-dimethyltransferase